MQHLAHIAFTNKHNDDEIGTGDYLHRKGGEEKRVRREYIENKGGK